MAGDQGQHSNASKLALISSRQRIYLQAGLSVEVADPLKCS
jgi:hypothetical protein